MSVVAWDGKTLAADRQATCAGLKTEFQKSWICGEAIVAITGGIAEGLAMKRWFEAGADFEKYPSSQATDDWCRFIVVTASEILTYERAPVAIPFSRDERHAWGSGRDFALGALLHGATSREAVEITNSLSNECGFGVDEHGLQPPE